MFRAKLTFDTCCALRPPVSSSFHFQNSSQREELEKKMRTEKEKRKKGKTKKTGRFREKLLDRKSRKKARDLLEIHHHQDHHRRPQHHPPQSSPSSSSAHFFFFFKIQIPAKQKTTQEACISNLVSLVISPLT